MGQDAGQMLLVQALLSPLLPNETPPPRSQSDVGMCRGGERMHSFKSRLCHLPAVWLWACGLASLGLNLLIHTVGIIELLLRRLTKLLYAKSLAQCLVLEPSK